MKKCVNLDIIRRRKFYAFELRFNVIKTLLKSKYLSLLSKRQLRQLLCYRYAEDTKLQTLVRRGCRFG
jgi:hypothetical protein